MNVTDSGSEDTEAEHKNEFLFKPCDNATEFQCTTSSLCVPKYWLCDGTVRTIRLVSKFDNRWRHYRNCQIFENMCLSHREIR